MALIDNFAEFWDENTNLELRGYPRKEVAKKAWDYQQAKLKEQAARIDALEDLLKHAYCGVVGSDSIIGLDCCDDYRDWLALINKQDT